MRPRQRIRVLSRVASAAQVETSLATMAYNLKTMLRVLGGSKMREEMAA